MAFKTTAAYISGGICGHIWQPGAGLCGKPLRADLKGPWSRPQWDKGDTFRDYLLSLLTHQGGDFQSVQFTDDTVLHVERRTIDGPGKYRVHAREIPLAKLADCADLVNADAMVGDFMGEDE